METIIKSLHESIKNRTGNTTQIMVVNLHDTSPHIWVNKDCYKEPGLPTFKRETYTGRNFRQLDKEIDKAAISREAKTMCKGISDTYTAEQIQSVGFGVFVFGDCSIRHTDTTQRYKNLQGFVACEMTEDELKIELICAGLRGLGTPLMKFIIQSAIFYNKETIRLEAATIELACRYYPIFGFKFTHPNETMDTVCIERTILRGDRLDRLDVNPLVRAPHDKMWNMHLKLETYNSKLRPRITLEEPAPVMFTETEETKIDDRTDGLIAEAAAEEAAAAAAAAAEAAAEAAAAAAEAAGGGPAPAEKGPKRGNGRTRKRKRSLKKKKKGGKNKTKRLKRKVGRNTRKKRKNNVH
jgi:hypothetical protein